METADGDPINRGNRAIVGERRGGARRGYRPAVNLKSTWDDHEEEGVETGR